jgi:hypothetical protein
MRGELREKLPVEASEGLFYPHSNQWFSDSHCMTHILHRRQGIDLLKAWLKI